MAPTAKTKARASRTAAAPKPKLGRRRSATVQTLASMIEEHMTDLGLPEAEKNRRVARFGERVDRAIANRAKS